MDFWVRNSVNPSSHDNTKINLGICSAWAGWWTTPHRKHTKLKKVLWLRNSFMAENKVFNMDLMENFNRAFFTTIFHPHLVYSLPSIKARQTSNWRLNTLALSVEAQFFLLLAYLPYFFRLSTSCILCISGSSACLCRGRWLMDYATPFLPPKSP